MPTAPVPPSSPPGERFKIAVFGLGDYYRKLRRYLDRHFEPVSLIDVEDPERLSLNEHERSLFVKIDPDADPAGAAGNADLCLILTPNRYHAAYAASLLRSGYATFLEKPVAISREDLRLLEEASTSESPLYLSDFYVDVRSIGLAWFFGLLPLGDWRWFLLSPRPTSRVDASAEIGRITEIRGTILESHSIHSHASVAQMEDGGVIRDLMVHLLALTRFLLPQEELQFENSEIRYHHPESPPGSYLSTALSAQAETYARASGCLVPSGVPVRFEVAKDHLETKRSFLVAGTTGHCEQFWIPGHPFSVKTRRGPRGFLRTDGDRYELAVRGLVAWMQTSRRRYGWEWSSWAAEHVIGLRERAGLSARSAAVAHSRVTVRAEEREAAARPSRRTVLVGLGWILNVLSGASAITHLLEESGLVVEPLRRTADEFAEERDPSAERLRLIGQLFSASHEDASREIVFSPGSEHRYGNPSELTLKRGFYPHDLRALAPYALLSHHPPATVDAASLGTVIHGDETVITTGSISSSSLCREVAREWGAILPYTLVELETGAGVRVLSGMEGREARKRHKVLVESATRRMLYDDRDHVDPDDWLVRDVLVLTVVPHSRTGARLFQLSGGHGAGTEAAALLFDESAFPAEDLQSLLRGVEGHSSFQAVFEVFDIERKGPAGITQARSIRLSTKAPPKPIQAHLQR